MSTPSRSSAEPGAAEPARGLACEAPLFAAAALCALAVAASPRVPVPDAAADLGAVVLSVAPALAALAASAPAQVGGRRLVLLAVVGAALLVAIDRVGLSAALAPLQVLGLLALARAIGGGVGRAVAHPGHMLAASLVAAAADLASVLAPEGPTHQIVESERALALLALAAPVPGTRALTFTLGVGDLIVIAMYLAVALKFGLSRRRVVLASALGLVVAFALAAFAGAAIPALVPIAAAVLALVPELRRVAPRDRPATLAGAAVALGVVVAVLLRVPR